jgi:hypothetical protein
MSSYSLALKNQPSIGNILRASSGASADAQRIRELYEKMFEQFAESATGAKRFADPIEEIYEVYRDALRPNWDGCGAKPIPQSAAEEARALLVTLPSHFAAPEIYGEGTGSIVFEWYKQPKHRFVLIIPGNGSLEYAGTFGEGNEIFGRARASGSVPKVIQDHLRDLFSA